MYDAEDVPFDSVRKHSLPFNEKPSLRCCSRELFEIDMVKISYGVNVQCELLFLSAAFEDHGKLNYKSLALMIEAFWNSYEHMM